MKIKLLTTALLIGFLSYGQGQTKRVLFLGNSYTYYNNLPELVQRLASSTGDSLEWQMHAPGGFSLYEHSINATTLDAIKLGQWDYVTLQDQSQVPTLPDYQMGLAYASAHKMDSLVKAHNSCGQSLFYMTWGRKNGDPLFHQVYGPWYKEATYHFMDSLLRLRYRQYADSSQAEVSPVGAVWRYLRRNHPSLELYTSDESHPSLIGSYAAACSFYTALFRKDPTFASFDASLPAATATTVRAAAKTVVYDSLLYWNIGKFDSLLAPGCLRIGLPDPGPPSAIRVFPNPVQSRLTIELAEPTDREQLKIYSATGRLMMVLEVKGSTKVDLSHWPSGWYTIGRPEHPQSAIPFYLLSR